MNNVYAIVPVKPFAICKSRLAPLLSPAERERLGRDFLRHTIDTVTQTLTAMRTIVVSNDATAIHLAADAGAYALLEARPTDMNTAIAEGACQAITLGAEALVVVPTDLPLLTGNDLREFLSDAAAAQAQMAVAPDHRDEGTNLLYLKPPRANLFRFGPRSLSAYRTLAKELGMTLLIYRSPGATFDIDTPADYQLWTGQRGTRQVQDTLVAAT